MLAALAALVSLSGCGLLPKEAREGISITPAEAGPSPNPSLGPGVRTLSFGPGDKGSPRVSPSNESVSFVLDGQVAKKPLYAQGLRRVTGEDLRAEHAEWLSDGALAVLGTKKADKSAEASAPSSLFVARGEETSPDDRELVERVGAMGALPGGAGVIAAAEMPPPKESAEEKIQSRLVLVEGSEEPVEFYPGSIEGRVTGLSVSPDGSRAVLAVLRGGGESGTGRFEVQVYRFSEGRASLAARVPEGMEIMGAPQWTSQGIHFVAGEVGDVAGGEDSGPYALYRALPDSEEPQPVNGVGEDFVAASASVSPDGDRLAVIGRRNPGAPTNLYVLDLASETLEAATTNEDMEIKTSPRDLAWAPNGRAVILVAREALSGPAVYDAPAEELLSAFYNLYQVPVGEPKDAE